MQILGERSSRSEQDRSSGMSTGSVDNNMESDLAELSTVATQIDELVERIVEVAEKYHGSDRADIAVRLFEVERSLKGAGRNLQSARRAFS